MSSVPVFTALALALLWLPTGICLSRHRRHKLLSPERNLQISAIGMLASVWSWVDLLRAWAGAWYLGRFVQVADLAQAFGHEITEENPLPPHWAAIWQVFLLGAFSLGVWHQVMLTGSRHLRLAPLFYLLGLGAGLLPWNVALFGSVLGLALTGLVGNRAFTFWLMPVAIAGIAVLYRTIGLYSALVPALYGLVAFLGLRPNHPLAWLMALRFAHQIRLEEPAAPPQKTKRAARRPEQA